MQSKEEAQNALTPITTYESFLDGNYITDEQISYFSLFTEAWANRLGEKVTGEKSMENLVID